jgi:hypothetical protein
MLQRQGVLNFNPLSLALATGLLLAVGRPSYGQDLGQNLGQDLGQELSQDLVLAQGNAAEPLARSEVAVPEAIRTALSQRDGAASQQDLTTLLKGYGDRYRNSDGLDRRELSNSLKRFWQQYPQLRWHR